MATPVNQPGAVPVPQLGRSPSFLQQLLEGIKGAGPPPVLQDQPTKKAVVHTPPVRVESRRQSSVWVGGTSIAQEARERLREADQARALKTIVTASRDAPSSRRASLRVQTSGLDNLSSSSDGSTAESSPHRSCSSPLTAHENVKNYPSPSTLFCNNETLFQRSTVGGLRLPDSVTFSAQAFEALDEATAQDSPPMFCDDDSDFTVTPSPTEAPTSAISSTLTDATTVTYEGPRTPSDSGSISRKSAVLIHTYLLMSAR
jgi:hypothetical protein